MKSPKNARKEKKEMTTTNIAKISCALPVNSIENAPESARPVLEKAKSMLGFVPNLYGMLSTNPETLNSYLVLSKAVEKSGLTSIEQQIVLLTVSIENNCEYCVAAHSAIATMTKVPVSILHALRNRQPLEDNKLESLRLFTSSIVNRRGILDQAEVEEFFAAGYDGASILAVITAIAMKTISNYANHIALTPLDGTFQSHAWHK